jgi:hypothetical protein
MIFFDGAECFLSFGITGITTIKYGVKSIFVRLQLAG